MSKKRPNIDDFRELATITDVKITDEDHGVFCPWIFLQYDGGGQGFGGYVLGKSQEGPDVPLIRAWKRELCITFGIQKYEQLKGKKCYALRTSMSKWGGTLVGLESIDTGLRFVAKRFFARELNQKFVSYADERRAELQREVEHHARRLRDAEQDLAKFDPSDVWEW